MRAIHINYSKTNRFPLQVLDYLNEEEWIKPFITAFPDSKALAKQIESKAGKVNRKVLHEILQQQYLGLNHIEAVHHSMVLILKENTFTICTAHQPNIFLGPLYVVLKTIHAIQLAKECQQLFPDNYFIPVFYIGSEDHDIDEIGTLHMGDETLKWQPSQKGSCGEYSLESIQEEVKKMSNYLSEYVEDDKWFMNLIRSAYRKEHTLAQATRYMLHELFGEHGLLVFDANHQNAKSEFKPVMKEELLKQSSYELVTKTIQKLPQKINSQATPREINLFYKKKNEFRERIVRNGNDFEVLNQSLHFSEEEILQRLDSHPDEFSPNVILRPLLQETLLPNIGFIGGGGELSYWLQLKSLFDHHHIPFPLLFLRQSVTTLQHKAAERLNKHHLSPEDLFLPRQELVKRKVEESDVKKQWHEIENHLTMQLKNWTDLSEGISPNLKESTDAHIARMNRLMHGLEKKFDRHILRNEIELKHDLDKLFLEAFPHDTLQERYVSFIDLWKRYGRSLPEALLRHTDPYGRTFLILMEE